MENEIFRSVKRGVQRARNQKPHGHSFFRRQSFLFLPDFPYFFPGQKPPPRPSPPLPYPYKTGGPDEEIIPISGRFAHRRRIFLQPSRRPLRRRARSPSPTSKAVATLRANKTEGGRRDEAAADFARETDALGPVLASPRAPDGQVRLPSPSFVSPWLLGEFFINRATVSCLFVIVTLPSSLPAHCTKAEAARS
jgi:hypothetical protein